MCKNTQIRKDRAAEHLYFVYTVMCLIGWHARIDRSVAVKEKVGGNTCGAELDIRRRELGECVVRDWISWLFRRKK
jgi:hypothetical protein